MKKLSLLIQLIVSFILMIIGFSIILGSVYYQTSSQVISNLTTHATQNSLNQAGKFIEDYLGKLRQTSNSLVKNQSVISYLTSSNPENQQQALAIMQAVLEAEPDLVAATLVSRTGEVISTDKDLNIQTSSNMMEENWYQKAILDEAMMPVLLPARLAHLSDNKTTWIISVTQEISDMDGNNLGVLRLDIDYATLATYLDRLDLGSTGSTFIIDADKHLVYHPKNKSSTSRLETEKLRSYFSISNDFTANHKEYVYHYAIPNTQWTLVGVSSLDALRAIEKKLFWLFFIIGFISLIPCSSLIWLILKRWMQPIKNLQAVILKVGQGNSSIRARETGAVELVDFARQFNAMLDRIEFLMASIQENEQSIRQYELQSLASQINPHFLYNTLDTIVWMAEFNDGERVVALTKSLARFFRIALNNGNEQIRLKDEIDHVRQYLYIQQQRYGEKLTYKIHELPTYDDYRLPKLILQPIVENAIYHGIKPVDWLGFVCLEVSQNKDHLIISISDNGQGFPKHLVNMTEIEEEEFISSGIGLKNVYQRLKLEFGDSFHMSIQSEKKRLTKVSLYFPKP